MTSTIFQKKRANSSFGGYQEVLLSLLLLGARKYHSCKFICVS